MREPATAEETGRADPAHGLVDCDVHTTIGDLANLAEYMPAAWAEQLNISGGAATVPKRQIRIPGSGMYTKAGGRRADAMSFEMPPGSDPEFVAGQLLDQHEVSRAILITEEMFGIGALPDGNLAATLASAHNRWLAERWLSFDPRYRGSIAVAPQRPDLGAEEIERSAGVEGFSCVFLPLFDVPMGDRHYHPIYEAAERHGLPVFVHPSGTENEYTRAPRMALHPTYYIEWHAALGQVHQSNTISLICQGTFETFPGLTVAIAEGGFAWAPDLMWRLDRNWKSLRAEVPWLRRPPSEYLVDHIRFTTQPFIEPRNRDHITQMLDMICAERTLMFSSDYPHWDFDDPQVALRYLDEPLKQRVLIDNAWELFGDRLA
jgi:predicted TIM-barrel fold metal-dependent hydrolase